MRLFLCLVTGLLPFDDALGDAARVEKIDGQAAVIAAVHLSIKHLLDDVIDNVV